MTRLALPLMLLLSLAACKRTDSDDTRPDASAMAAPATLATPAPADATMAPSAAEPASVGAASSANVSGGSEAGTMANGQTDATLTSDLAHCETLAAAEQAACRSDAQDRYTERAASGTQAPPTTTP